MGKLLLDKGLHMPSKILIVDDEVHLARILQFTLEHAGFDVRTAFDGREALEKAKQERPDLIILDLMLPIIDGYKVCNILKSDEEFKTVPIIILSARDLSREELEEPISADLYMEKPFNTNNLIEKISELLT
jgi:two-component system alkaline phosphatase synthesis response regulator PhoP